MRIFVDAILTDDEAHNLIFISLSGRDTSMRELQARITLGDTDSGLIALNIYRPGAGVKQYVDLFNAASLEQVTGSISDSILGDLVHCYLYQKAVVYPDLLNHRSILIDQDNVHERITSTPCSIPSRLFARYHYSITGVMFCYRS